MIKIDKKKKRNLKVHVIFFLISHIEKAKIMRLHVKDILTILIKKYIPATVHNLMRKMKHLQSKIMKEQLWYKNYIPNKNNIKDILQFIIY